MSEWLTDLGARLRQGRERSRTRRLAFNEAIAAVRAVSAGKSKDEVRELLTSELRTRDITPPVEPFLSHMADRVLADAHVLTQLRLVSRGLGILIDHYRGVTRDIKEQFRATGPHMDLGNVEPLLIRGDRSRPGAQVLLDPDAQQWLDTITDLGSQADFSEIPVLLSWAGLGRDSGQVAVRVGDRRVGVLTAVDSEDFPSILEQGSQQIRPVLTMATLGRAPDTSWHLTVFRPAAGG
jgi:hypothetical protein